MLTVSAIVPAFNEHKKIKSVVTTLLKSPHIQEVICVNDGSTDKTLEILKSFGNKITLIDLKKNRGKGYALAIGIKKAKGDLVAFFDADLVNFQQLHINLLLKPILKDKTVRAVIGYPTRGGYFAKWLKDITGERVYYKKDLLPFVASLKTKNRISLEVFLTTKYARKKVTKVSLKGLGHLFKHEKYGLKIGAQEEIKSWKEAAAEITRETVTSFSFLAKKW